MARRRLPTYGRSQRRCGRGGKGWLNRAWILIYVWPPTADTAAAAWQSAATGRRRAGRHASHGWESIRCRGGQYRLGSQTTDHGARQQAGRAIPLKGQGAGWYGESLVWQAGKSVDPARFAQAVQTDPRQFRFSVNPPRNAPYCPLQAYTEVLMSRVEKDLGRPLDWIAAVHHDTHIPMSMSCSVGKMWRQGFIYQQRLSESWFARAGHPDGYVVAWAGAKAAGAHRSRTQEPRTQQTVRRSLGHQKEQRQGQEMGL